MFRFRHYSASERVLIILCGFLFTHALLALAISGNKPLSDEFEFRQTQTALSAFWMTQEGLKAIYQTPVVGSPWEIPFEFPTYQWLVATLDILGLPLNLAGRLVSFIFFVACLLPLASLGRSLALGRWWILAVSALFLASPLYVLWGRSFMIETMALFFAAAHLSCFVAGLTRDRLSFLVWSCVCAILAILTKSTTLPAFSLMAGIFFLSHVAIRPFSRGSLSFRTLLAPSIVLIAAYPLGLYWVAVSDASKSHNIVGNLLTSEALAAWNYGTLEQKLSSLLWLDVLPHRMMADIIGPWAAITVALFLFLQIFPLFQPGLSRRQSAIFACMILGFLTPLLIFTNLHLVHNYYQVANGIFVVAGLALLIDASRARIGDRAAMVLLVGVVASQLAMFHETYYKKIERPYLGDDYKIARIARDLTPQGSALLVFGIDWTSTVAYYSERKTLTFPNWLPAEQTDELLANPQDSVGGLDIGGIVYCRNLGPGQLRDKVEAFVVGHEQLGVSGSCTLYRLTRPL
jgi:hypothetical protein